MYVYLCLACATVGNKDPSRNVALMETTAWEDGLRATAGVIFLSTNCTWCQAVLCCEDCLRCTRTGMGRRASLDATLRASSSPPIVTIHENHRHFFFFRMSAGKQNYPILKSTGLCTSIYLKKNLKGSRIVGFFETESRSIPQRFQNSLCSPGCP